MLLTRLSSKVYPQAKIASLAMLTSKSWRKVSSEFPPKYFGNKFGQVGTAVALIIRIESSATIYISIFSL